MVWRIPRECPEDVHAVHTKFYHSIYKMGNIQAIEPKYTINLSYLTEVEPFLDIEILRLVPDATNILLSINVDDRGRYSYSMRTTPSMSTTINDELDLQSVNTTEVFTRSNKSIRHLINIYKKLPPFTRDYYKSLHHSSNLIPRIKVSRTNYYRIMNTAATS